jgi:hypothetical protein
MQIGEKCHWQEYTQLIFVHYLNNSREALLGKFHILIILICNGASIRQERITKRKYADVISINDSPE